MPKVKVSKHHKDAGGAARRADRHNGGEDDMDEELRKALELSKRTAMKEEEARIKEATVKSQS